MVLPTPLRGIVPPLGTPLLERDKLDRFSVERLIDNMLRAGVHGIFALGTTGEGASLSQKLRGEFVQLVCSVVRGRVPVLVNVTDTAIAATLSLAHHAAQSGASGLVIAPPYYFPLSQGELLRYLERITPELPLPVYLYNYPQMMKTAIAPATVRRSAELPNMYGIKDSSRDIDYLTDVIRLCADRPDFAVLCGPEHLLAQALALGAHGGVTGGANLWPQLYLDLYQAASDGHSERVDEIERVIADVSAHVYGATCETSRYIRGMKCALALAGLCRNVLAEPFEAYGTLQETGIPAALVANRFPFQHSADADL